MFLDIFCNQKRLETGKSLENNDFSRDSVVFLFLDPFESRKCLKTGEMTKSLEKVIYSRDIVVSHVS